MVSIIYCENEKSLEAFKIFFKKNKIENEFWNSNGMIYIDDNSSEKKLKLVDYIDAMRNAKIKFFVAEINEIEGYAPNEFTKFSSRICKNQNFSNKKIVENNEEIFV